MAHYDNRSNENYCATHNEHYHALGRCPACAAEASRGCPVEAQIEGRPLTAPTWQGTNPNIVLTPKANERQIGGVHYGKVLYRHWDFATDVNLHYLIGCGSKYVLRHQDKNGMQDLEKCIHYLQKAEERDIRAMELTPENFRLLDKFSAQLPLKESRAVLLMCTSRYLEAASVVRELLEELGG